MARILTPDICVIGGGSAGLSVAAGAAAFGVSVVLIEKHKMGGDCLNYGCVPSKALIASAKRAAHMRDAGDFGIKPVEPAVDFGKVNRHVRSVIEAIAPNDSVERFTALGVTVIQAEARFKNRRTVVAGDAEIRARRFVIATGSSPLVPPIPGLDGVPYLTNETLFDQTRKPKRLIIIGGGPIGMEMAQAHRRLGCEVVVLEGAKALGRDDPELARVVLEKLGDEGVEIREETKVVGVAAKGKTAIRVDVEGPQGRDAVEGTHLLLAVGRKPNLAGLDLERGGIRQTKRGIRVSPTLRTSNRRVYAIGDVAGGLQFTHVASYHAGLVLRAILFRLRATEKREIIPWTTYTDPELAHVGLSEEEARKTHRTIRILRWPLAENDRAQAERATSGFIKVITDKRGKILGAGIAGLNAGELIGIWALAISKSLNIRDMTGYVAPYPTMGEIGKRAAVTYFAGAAAKPIVRRIIRLLRIFG